MEEARHFIAARLAGESRDGSAQRAREAGLPPEHRLATPPRPSRAGPSVLPQLTPVAPPEEPEVEAGPSPDPEAVCQQLAGSAALPEEAARLLPVLFSPATTIFTLCSLIQPAGRLAVALDRYARLAGLWENPREADVARIVTCLGVPGLRRLTYLSLLAESLVISPEQDMGQRRKLWFHSLDCAVQTARWVFSSDEDLDDAAFGAGLFHDLGRIALLRWNPALFFEIEARARVLGRPVEEAERARISIDHAQLGAWLAARWGLPPEICFAIEVHHQAPDSPGMTRLASAVAAAERLPAAGHGRGAGDKPLDELGILSEVEGQRTGGRLRPVPGEEVDRFWAQLFDLPYRLDAGEFTGAEVDLLGALTRWEGGRLFLLSDDGRAWERTVRFDAAGVPVSTPYRLMPRRGLDFRVAEVLECPAEAAGNGSVEISPQLLRDLRILRFDLHNYYVGIVHRVLPPSSRDRSGSPRTADAALTFDEELGTFRVDGRRYARLRGRSLGPRLEESSLELSFPLRIQVKA